MLTGLAFFTFYITRNIKFSIMVHSGSISKRKILIVDDIAFNRTVLTKILSKSGHELAIAISGEQALAQVEIFAPDVILLDFMMPGMNGLDVLRALKGDGRFREIPVIFLTASDEMESMTDAFNAGAVDYITKPFKAAELNARVNTQIRQLDDADAIKIKVQEQQELIHVLAHDLRNPLVACRGLVELVEAGDADISLVGPRLRLSMQKCLDTIELVRKKGLIEHDVSKLSLEPIVAHEAMEMVIAEFQEPMRSKGIRIENKIPANLVLSAERTSLINIVFSNIISNAIKFSYPNSKVDVIAEATEYSVTVKVVDRGMGIPEFLLPQIFNPRKVTRRAGTLNEQGTGYGMGLVRKLMLAYRGVIDMESVAKSVDNRNHGTTILLTFPRVKVAEPEEVVEV
jgi:two-component system, sensor histidine kinase and response regulator